MNLVEDAFIEGFEVKGAYMENRHSCKECSNFSHAQNKEPFGKMGAVTFVCPVTQELLFSEFMRLCEQFSPADDGLPGE